MTSLLCAQQGAIHAQAPGAAPLVLGAGQAWQVQPAQSPTTPPDESAWGALATQSNWRNGGGLTTNPRWANTPRGEVHSLWLQQNFQIPAAFQGQRIFLDFRRIEGDAIVFCNGQRVAEVLRPGGEVQITSFAKPGEINTLRVFLTRNYTGISRDFKNDPLRYLSRQANSSPLDPKTWGLGLTGPVTLAARPARVGISDVFVQTSWRQKQLALDVELDAATAASGLVLVGEVVDAAGKPALTLRSQPLSATPGTTRHEVRQAWANPIPWELDGGYLYTLKLRLEEDGKVQQRWPDLKFGFRELWQDGRQLILNGHPTRFRLSSLMQGGESNVNSLQFFRQIGYNVFIFQNNPSLWWRDWAETPLWSEEVLDAMDATGSGVLMPAPGMSYHLRNGFMTDPAVPKALRAEMDYYVRRYRNRPSILAWTVGMNSYNPRSAIAPQGMGRRETAQNPQVRSINAVVDMIKTLDKTRLAYSHADGGTGDIASANVYLNFAPLQEREEWPSSWAASGNMPFMAAEFGQPYTANFWKEKRFLLTEYLAMHFGEEAYLKEGEAGLKSTLDYGLKNQRGHGSMLSVDLKQYPLYWDYQRLYVRNTNRSWRSWGVNGGWSYWVYDMGYGEPPGVDTTRGGFVNSRYRDIKAPVEAKPNWVSPNYEIHQQDNQKLMVYIAGAPAATDKTHSYFARENVQKQAALVWDGPGEETVNLSWRLEVPAGIQWPNAPTGRIVARLSPGQIQHLPFNFTVPPITGRTKATLILQGRTSRGETLEDRLDLQFFPDLALQTAVQRATQWPRVTLWDPAGKSGLWLKALGITPTPYNGGSLQGVDVLIVGREALGPGRKPPYTPADIARGLRVLVLEQRPEVWQGLGFQFTDTAPRHVFANDRTSPILKDVRPEDLINWRGSPDLLPEGVNRETEVLHAPRWTNRHTVASVALKTPATPGITPVLTCEFDLGYSPLLDVRYGKGQVLFSSLDLTGRVGVDPAATLLASNILRSLGTPLPVARKVQAVGDTGKVAAELLLEAGNGKLAQPESTVVLAGANAAAGADLQKFVENGGRVLHLPVTAEGAKAAGLGTASREVRRVTGGQDALLRGIGPGLLRWRDALQVEAFTANPAVTDQAVLAEGLLLRRTRGQGSEVFCQVSPAAWDGRYADSPEKAQTLQPSLANMSRLLAQLLTNSGAGLSEGLMERLCYLKSEAAFQPLAVWQVLGPFGVEKEDGEAMLKTAFPGEAEAIAGDTNPNLTFKRADGVSLDWRGTVKSDETGFIDLGGQLKAPSLAVAYLTREVKSKTARMATLQLGADYRVAVWVNGKLTFRTLTGGARANAYQVKVPLQAGTNVITLKVASGSRGFGVWTSLSSEDSDAEQNSPLGERRLYPQLRAPFDPYEFHYW